MNKVIHGDSLEILKTIKPHSVELLLTDPPYGTTQCSWDTTIPFDRMWQEILRVAKEDAALVFIAGQPFTSALIMSNPDMFRYCWYWEKEQPTNPMQMRKRAGKTVEEVVVFYKKQPTYNPQMRKFTGKKVTNKIGKAGFGKLVDSGQKKPFEYKDTGYRYPTQVLSIRRDVRKTNLHPTQKPIELMKYLIETYSNEGDTVLDPFLGSGTTLVACKQLNRKGIGIEREKEYVKIAKTRINAAPTSLL